MKYLNKLLLIAVALVFVTACDNTELDLQENPNAVGPDQASINDLYHNIQLTFGGIFQQLEQTPGAAARMYHAGAFNYESWHGPTDFNGLWFNAYSNLFPDVDALVILADERGLKIHSGSAKILKAYTMMGLVDLFGNVPYSQAGQGTDVISPAADPGDQVYSAAISLLDEAIGELTGTNAAAPANDLFYGGDAALWTKAAKTLKLRAAVATRLVDPSGAASTVNALVSEGDIIDENTEDFQGHFGSQRTNPNSRHYKYNNHYETGDGDYLSNYYMWKLCCEKQEEDGTEIRDPRTNYYFYRKVEKTAEQDLTTYSCHFSISPDQSAQPAHYATIDPRLPYCIASADGYSGRDHLNGEGIPPDGPIRTSYGLYPGGGQFDDATFQDTRQQGTTGGLGAGIIPVLLASYTDFLRAEAALTIGTSDDPRALLESGIRKSMDKVESFEDLVSSLMSEQREVRGGGTASVKEIFGLSQEKIDAYVNFVLVQYDAAGSDDERLDIIMNEYYIALWGNGLEAYNMYRRTGKPNNMAPGLEPAFGEFVNTFFLPDVHVNRNANATQKSSFGERVFWDDGSAGAY